MTNQQVERIRHRRRERELIDALTKLANEASGFLERADYATHGHTNIAVLRNCVLEAREVIAKASE